MTNKIIEFLKSRPAKIIFGLIIIATIAAGIIIGVTSIIKASNPPPACPPGQSLNEDDNQCYKNICFKSCSEPNTKTALNEKDAPNCNPLCNQCEDGYAPPKDRSSGCFPVCGPNGYGCKDNETCVIYNSTSDDRLNYFCAGPTDSQYECSGIEYNGKPLMCNDNDAFLCPSSDNELCTLAPGTSTCESGSEQVCKDGSDCPAGISCELNSSKLVGVCNTQKKEFTDYLCCTKDKVSLDNTQYPPIPTCCKQHENPFPKGNGCCKGEVTITGNCCKSDEIATTNGDCCNPKYVVSQSEGTFCCTSSALEGSTVSISEHKDRCYSITNYAGITEDKKTCKFTTDCKYHNNNKNINPICYKGNCRIQCGEYNLEKNKGSGPKYIPIVHASKIDNTENEISACAMNKYCTFNPSPQFSPARGTWDGKNINILKYHNNNNNNWWNMESKTNKKDYTSTITSQFNSPPPGSSSQCNMDDCLYALVQTPPSIGSKNIFKKPTKYTSGGCSFEYDGNDFGEQWPNLPRTAIEPTWNESLKKYTGNSKDCRTSECRYLQTGIYCESPKRSYDGRTCVSFINNSQDLCNRTIYKNNKSNKAQIYCQMPNGDSIHKYEYGNDVYYIQGHTQNNPFSNKDGWLYYKSKLNKYTPTSGTRPVNEIRLHSASMYNISGDPPYKLATTNFTTVFNFFNVGYYPDTIFAYIRFPDLTKSVWKPEKRRYEYSMFLKKETKYLTFDTDKNNFKLVEDTKETNLLLTVNFTNLWHGQNNRQVDYGINTSLKDFSSKTAVSPDVLFNLVSGKYRVVSGRSTSIELGSSIFPIYNPDNKKWALVSIPLALLNNGPYLIPYGSNIFYLSIKYTFKQYMLCGGGRGGGGGGSTSCRQNFGVCPYNWGYYCDGISKDSSSSIWPGLPGVDFPINTHDVKDILWFDKLDIFSNGLTGMADDDILIKNQNNTTNSFTNFVSGKKTGYNQHFSVPNNVYSALESNFDNV